MNLDKMKKSIEDIGTELGSQEDWMPALIMEKQGQSMILGLGGDCMGNQETKDMTAKLMTALISDIQPESVCFVSTARSVRMDPERADNEKLMSGTIRVSQHPDRYEIVVCACAGKDWEKTMIGEILRSPDGPPKIKKWDMLPGGRSEGRFPDALRDGFKNRKEKYGDNKT